VIEGPTGHAERAGYSRRASSGGGLTGTRRAVTALREGIRAGRYVPGQRLVEADLAAEIGVGRNSLREAFSRLASEGLVLIEPHRGASIRRRTRAEVAQLYDLSEDLEGRPLAARQSTSRGPATSSRCRRPSIGCERAVTDGAANQRLTTS